MQEADILLLRRIRNPTAVNMEATRKQKCKIDYFGPKQALYIYFKNSKLVP